MGRKKSSRAVYTKLLERPWCYYCERDFDDLKVLISHQRAQHFKCDKCNKRLNTAGGLVIHAQQVHKENLSEVFNSIKGREDASVEIFGLEGIPADAVSEHEEKIREKYNIPESFTVKPLGIAAILKISDHAVQTNQRKHPRLEDIDRVELQQKVKDYVAAKKAKTEE
ncbi:uncharacterized protein V1516DRAFT_667422 [Lipomyces oligophaga]|uniref:uncharacterized protein n=1 Tax=Lipomyces oligophaga TaxID=45792 RepID=UPI0034CEFF02